jgi:hypothetical protein
VTEESFSIYVSGKCSEIRQMGVWVATTYAKSKRSYSVEFDGIGECSESSSLTFKALLHALNDLDLNDLDAEASGIEINLFIDDPQLADTIANRTPGQIPKSAGLGISQECFQMLERQKVAVFEFNANSDKRAKELRNRLNAILAEVQ